MITVEKVEFPSGRVGYEVQGLIGMDIFLTPEQASDLAAKLQEAIGQTEITKSEIESLIRQEIAWCNLHPELVRQDYQSGFVAGLNQVLTIIAGAEKALKGRENS